MNNLKNKEGFTLIELIVVIAMLGILMLFLVPSFMGYAKDAKTQVLRANTRTVWTAVNASIVKSEYNSSIILANYKVCDNVSCKNEDMYNLPLRIEVEGKLGEEFKYKTGVMFDGETNVLDYVIFFDGKKQCQYYGSDKFDESGCTYK